jgi:hypothetical protein
MSTTTYKRNPNSSYANREIVDRHDDLLLDWLDLYEEAFPQEERIPVSAHLRP